MKKTLTMILTLALVICMLPTSAFANENENTVQTTKLDVSGITVSVKNASAEYNGDVQTPKLQFTGRNAAQVKDEHYNIIWTKKGEISVKNVGNYTGTFTWKEDKTEKGTKQSTLTFMITPLNLSSAIISLQANAPILDTDIDDNNTVNESGKNKILIQRGTSNLKGDRFAQDVDIAYTYAAASESNPASVTAIISAKTDNKNVVNSRQASFSVTTDLSDADIALKQPRAETFTYNGTAQTPKYGIVVTKNNKPISESGYTVQYSNNINAGGWGTATITGTGLYSGTAIKPNLFLINQKSINATGININVSTGTSSTNPTVTIKDGTNLLTKDKDYQVTFSGDVATITGINNYKDSTTRTFSLVNKSLTSATVYQGPYYYSGTTQEPSMTVSGSDGRTPLTKGTDYMVTYTQNGKEVTPKDAGTYNITIIGKGQYAGTIEKSFIITPYQKKDIVVSSPAGYNTANPTATVKSIDGKITFVPGKDYKITSMYQNTSKNTVTVYMTTMGNIEAGTISPECSLVSKPISSCTVSFKDGRSSAAYTGSNIPINLVVKDGYYTTLTQGRDYKVTYKNAAGKVVSAIKDAGTYTIELTGQNGYTGTTSVTFTVTGTDIGNYTVTLKESKVSADGRSKTPVITSVAYGYASRLNTTDYTVSYQDSTGKEVKPYQMSAPGTYRVVVTGKNGYTGSCYANFTIEGLAQSITGVNNTYKVYPTSNTFKLYPKAAEGTFTYTSSDPSVASVDAYGYVTPHKAGRAKIKISTTGNVKYNPANDSTVIKVYPNKAKLTRKPWSTGKGKIKVRWNKQDNVTRYEVRYSKYKSFKKGTYKTKKRNAAVNFYTTQSTIISGLSRGYTYYVKVRAVKEVYNDYGKKLTYYGRWSGWRSVRVK